MNYNAPITYITDNPFLEADALFAVLRGHGLELDVSDEFSLALEGAFLEFTETGLFRAEHERTTEIHGLDDGLRRLDQELTTLTEQSETLAETLRYTRARDLTREAATEAGVHL
ncbi:MAG: hypothetical protein L0H93_15285 [Nocardioides sp.]|nr:hypothetical protein [Nocardioides sp.]